MSSRATSASNRYIGCFGCQRSSILRRERRLCISNRSGRIDNCCRTQNTRMRPTGLNWRRRRARARFYACVYWRIANVVLCSMCNILHVIAKRYRIDFCFKVAWVS